MNGTGNSSRIDAEATVQEKKTCRHVWEPNGALAYSLSPPEDAWKCNRCGEKNSKPMPGVELIPDVTEAKKRRRRV